MSTIYSAKQIIGKTLIANSPVDMKRVASDSASPVYTVKKGQPVGVVYSYLLSNATRKSLYWMFEVNGGYYYTAHKEGLFSLQGLASQGALTIQEEVKQQEENNKDAFDKTKDIVNLLLIGVGIWGGVELLKTFKSE